MIDIILYKDRNMTDKRIKEGIEAIYYCLKKYNYNFKFNNFDNYEESKIAIMWGIYCNYKSNTLYRKKIYENQKKKGNKVLIIEVGFLKRDIYYSLGWNSIVNFGKYNLENISENRWKELNINLKENKINNDGYILLCGQVPWDTQLQHINYKKWLFDIVNEIRKYTNRKIVYRPHPKQNKKNKMAILNVPNTINSKNESILDDFKDTYAVIALNSNSLLDAMIEGLPIFAFDKGTVVYDLANHNISNIENPKFPTNDEKFKKLYEISYMQWNEAELKNNIAIKYILNI